MRSQHRMNQDCRLATVDGTENPQQMPAHSLALECLAAYTFCPTFCSTCVSTTTAALKAIWRRLWQDPTRSELLKPSPENAEIQESRDKATGRLKPAGCCPKQGRQLAKPSGKKPPTRISETVARGQTFWSVTIQTRQTR